MTWLVIQSALLIAIAYILGCILGCLLHRWFSVPVATSAKEELAVKPASVAVSKVKVEEEPATLVADASEVDLVEAEPEVVKAKPKKKVKTKAKSKGGKDKLQEKAKAKAKKQVEAKAKVKSKPKAKAKSGGRNKKDDLKLIKGIGVQNEAKLNALKITSFAQIADWKAKDIQEIGDRLEFGGRIKGEKWISQAKKLAAGKQTQFSKRVLKGEVASSQSKSKK